MPRPVIEANVIDVATGERGLFTQALVPLDGLPPAKVESYPPHLFDDLH